MALDFIENSKGLLNLKDWF